MKRIARIKIFEGIPHPYSHKKRRCVPQALKVLRLKNFRKNCLLGDLCASVGWNHGSLIERLEAKRQERAKTYYKQKISSLKATKKGTTGLGEVKKIRGELAKYGY